MESSLTCCPFKSNTSLCHTRRVPNSYRPWLTPSTHNTLLLMRMTRIPTSCGSSHPAQDAARLGLNPSPSMRAAMSSRDELSALDSISTSRQSRMVVSSHTFECLFLSALEQGHLASSARPSPQPLVVVATAT